MPLFFKLWFCFVFGGVILIFGASIWLSATAVSMAGNPEELGSYLGRIAKGFEDGRQ